MRPLTQLLLLFALLTTRPGFAGTITVTPSALTVETSRLRLQWDSNYPEALNVVVFKDYSPYVNLSTGTFGADQFWGQSMRNLNGLGFIQLSSIGAQSWQVTAQTDSYVQVTITSQSAGQPPVLTRYTIVADQPWFTVDRTIGFSALADTSSYQAYVPRMPYLADYRALRWRDPSGTLVQRGFCVSPCMTSSWDGHWVQQLDRGGTGQGDLGVISIFPPGAVSAQPLVRGSGPLYPNGWAAPRVPAGAHTADATWREMVAFTTAPDDLAAIDALYAEYASGAALAGVSGTAAVTALRLEVAPNPARGPATLAWTNPVAGDVTLDVLDIAGRHVARLRSGASPAGPQRATWDGRGERGERVAPGVYLARLVTPAGAATTSIVRAN